MSSNEKILTKKEFKSGFIRSLMLSCDWNFERQMHVGFCFSMIPFIDKLYKNKQDRAEAYKRHMEFYNTHATLHPFILGVVAAMEEENAQNPEFDTSSISAVKIALMSPLAGIGDSLLAGTLRMVLTGAVAGLCAAGSILGPILFLLGYNIPNFAIRYLGLKKGYELGTEFISKISNSETFHKVTEAISIVGLMVLGAMVATLVTVNTPLTYGIGDNMTALQDTLDSIFPCMLPLATTGLMYKLMKKGISPIILIVATMILGIAGFALGIIA